MADISNFQRFKDWLLLGVMGILFALLGVLHSASMHRLDITEARGEASWSRIEAHAARLATIEAVQNSQRDETFRRLDRIERKLDDIKGGDD